jgi:hypothetical protein
MTARSHSHPLPLVVLAAIVATAIDTRALSPPAKTKPDLTGTWVLNHDLSDRPGQGATPGSGSGDSGGRRPGGMGGRSGMGGPGGGFGGRGGGGSMPNREDMERTRSAMDAVMRAPARLIIVSAHPGLVITDEEGVSTRLALNGDKETGAVNGVPFESTTKWDGGTLRVERKFKGGLKVEDAYSISSDPRLLTVTSKIEGGRGERTIRRVYDPREPSLSEN